MTQPPPPKNWTLFINDPLIIIMIEHITGTAPQAGGTMTQINSEQPL